VVRLATEEEATITIQLCTRSVTLPLSGPPYQIAVTGSGAFISSNGDILTADHVVDVPDAAVVEFAAQDIATLLDNASSVDPGCPSQQVSPTDVASGLVNFNFTAHVSKVVSFAWLGTSYTGPLTVTALRDVPRLDTTKLTTSSFTQNDLAIVHVNMNDTPSVQLDDSSQVAVDDHLTVIGFPGNGDVNFNPTNFLTPSVNNAQVSAIKLNDNGSQLIQVGGNVEHGDSGGPVLDDAGHIVGVVSFAGPDPLGITSFLRTSDDALGLAQNQGLSLTPGPFQKAWSRAFSDYAATTPGHWHTAANEMQQLAAAYPQFQALTPYLNYAKTAAAQETQPNAPSTPIGLTALPQWMLIAAGVVLLLLCVGIGVGVWLLVRRGRRKRAAKAAANALPSLPISVAPGYPAASYPSYPGAGAPPTMPPPGASYPPAPSVYGYGASSYGASSYGASGYGASSYGASGYGASGYAGPATGSPFPPASDPASGGGAWPGAAPAAGGGASVLTASPPAGGAPAGGAQAAPGQPAPAMVLCANGHWFAATDTRCPWCGAPPVSAPRAGTGPDTAPWS
jgi:hypothetical protein